ncbi:MAG: DinB family protein [Acidobacteria bacterium]|nr:DinB family protein [Acidobacteriota bacterium]
MSELAELLERFRRGAELVAVAATGAAGSELDWTPGPGRWSVRQILCHLADSEMVGADRLRRIIAEENPTLVAYDQDAWARNLDYTRRKVSQALEMFRRIRSENYELLKDVPEPACERIGTHSERGRVTLRDMLETYAKHAEGHAAQIRAVREQYKAERAGKA